MDIQNIFDMIIVNEEKKRAETQMTLGELISRLKELGNIDVDGFNKPDSYRGYYTDLAFEPTHKKEQASNLLEIAKECLGKKFYGYKGGEYTMTKITPVWFGFYGSTEDSKKIISIGDDGVIVTKDDDC